MNIVKFKDIYLETNKFSTPEQEKYNTIYNEQLKNKYWGVINWKWLAPLDMYFAHNPMQSQQFPKAFAVFI